MTPSARSRQALRVALVIAVAVVALVVWLIGSSGDEDDGESAGTDAIVATTSPATSTSTATTPGPSLIPAPATAPVTTTGPASTPPPAATTDGTDPFSGLDWVSVDDLPPEAVDTLDLIASGGPFPYDRDGATFENREGLLPAEVRGYYREYTVETPGSDDRGARRIVVGKNGELYYTADHYDSFERIAT